MKEPVSKDKAPSNTLERLQRQTRWIAHDHTRVVGTLKHRVAEQRSSLSVKTLAPSNTVWLSARNRAQAVVTLECRLRYDGEVR